MKFSLSELNRRQRRVVDCLEHQHKLERDTLLRLIIQEGQLMRDAVEVGMPADAIANEMAGRLSK